MKVSFVLPCRNEEDTVGPCVREVSAVLSNLDFVDAWEVVVSDSSSDESAIRAERAGARVVHHGQQGYGVALKEGIEATRYDIIVYADADGTYDFSNLAHMLKATDDGTIVMGIRTSIDEGAMPQVNRWLGNPVLSALNSGMTRNRFQDSQSGYRALTKKGYRTLDPKSDGMEFASEMLLRAAEENYNFVEIPTHYRKRIGSTKLRRWKDGVSHLVLMFEFIPGRSLLLPGSILIAFGVLLYRAPILSFILVVAGYSLLLLWRLSAEMRSRRLRRKRRDSVYAMRIVSVTLIGVSIVMFAFGLPLRSLFVVRPLDLVALCSFTLGMQTLLHSMLLRIVQEA